MKQQALPKLPNLRFEDDLTKLLSGKNSVVMKHKFLLQRNDDHDYSLFLEDRELLKIVYDNNMLYITLINGNFIEELQKKIELLSVLFKWRGYVNFQYVASRYYMRIRTGSIEKSFNLSECEQLTIEFMNGVFHGVKII